MSYLHTSPVELTNKKMIILIPFELLKLRSVMEKEHSPENLELLKNLIQNDIIGSINTNLALGNIEQSDADKLLRLTHQLYKHIYAHYEEMEVLNEMTDESLMLDIDIIEKKYEEKFAKQEQQLVEQAAEIAALKKQLAEALAK
ncbi:MAG: hypothetical protein J6J86_09035 [Lachnospiraceae bacterium]|nr:hypothetical protein [Lachnospiraceae bacterium]